VKLLSRWLPGITVCAVSSLLLVDPLPARPEPVERAADPPRPNVIVVLADDLGWLDTTPYGSRYYETPALERLAARGLRFTEAYAASPLCSPTRASLLTGQWPGRLRFTTPAGHLAQVVLDPQVPDKGPPHQKALTPATRTRLPNDLVTYAELMRDAGYATAFMGKWHLGRDPYLPDNQGFDLVVGGREHPGPPPPGNFFAPWNIDTLPKVESGTHVCDVVTDQALKFIEKKRDGPFLLNLWFYDVHAPFQAKEKLKAKYAKKTDPRGKQDCPTMGGMIEVMDTNLGRVLDKLAELGIEEDTLIVFTSDNGGNMYNEVEGTTPTNNAPLRSGKGNAYEGGSRVPLIVSWPGKVSPGVDSKTIASTVDWFPTLLDLLDLDPPAGQPVDGTSLLPVLRGGTLDRDTIYCHFPHYVKATFNLPCTWVRKGDWKLFRFFCDNDDQSDRLELYNLRDDIGETKNLAAEMPELTRQLNDLITAHLVESASLVPKKNPGYGKHPPAGWSVSAQTTLEKKDGEFRITSTGGDPWMLTRDVPKDASGPLRVELRMKTNAGNGSITWATRKEPKIGKPHLVGFPVKDGDEIQTIRVDFEADSPLTVFRLDPGTKPGTIVIESIRLLDSSGKELKKW